MEIETDSYITDDHIKTATTFGIGSSDLIDTKKYAIAFMNRLLLHNEKINKNLLEAHLNPVIATLWQEVLSSLEDTNRKLLNIKSGSLILTLFCPTDSSLHQLQDKEWRIKLQAKVEKLLKALGMLEINVFLKNSTGSIGKKLIDIIQNKKNTSTKLMNQIV